MGLLKGLFQESFDLFFKFLFQTFLTNRSMFSMLVPVSDLMRLCDLSTHFCARNRPVSIVLGNFSAAVAVGNNFLRF